MPRLAQAPPVSLRLFNTNLCPSTTMPDLGAVNNFFNTYVNQYQEPIYNRIFRTNPYMTLIPRAEFVDSDGLQPQVVTSTSELPSEYPTDLPNLALSDGTGDSCNVAPGTVLDGNIVRNYQLELDAWKSRVFCLTDLQFDWQAAEMIRNFQLNLGQFTTVRWSDWYRIKNLCMINGKVATISNTAFDIVEDSNCDFSGLSIGSSLANIEWTHLNDLYDMQIRVGAGEYAVGYSEGQPLFALAMGPGQKRYLFQTDTKTRETVNWGDAFQNFTARGINTSINGFIPNVDEFPLRYDENMNLIYPTINANATKGKKWLPNPAYKTVANGGDAVFEVMWIMPRSIWECRVRPIGATAYGMASFNPINYVGDLQWINNKTFGGENDQGNKGYYRMDLQMAAKPIFPEFGYSIITAARD